VLHLDGHDARREKWRGLGTRYYLWATGFGIRVAHRVIVDSRAVQLELGLAEDESTVFIPYGAKQSPASPDELVARLREAGLEPRGYHLVVARFEPENHVLDVIQGYRMSKAQRPLVVVGFEGYPGRYAKQIVEAASCDPRVRLVGAVWDQSLLDAMYAGAASYLHGHSVGGTNPSLLRAMIHTAPIIAYDCPYNRETTGGWALWFEHEREIAAAIDRVDADPGDQDHVVEQARQRAASEYVWADVVESYEALLRRSSA
jgi:glycosyltransferase involved in cell wall biosynthesis